MVDAMLYIARTGCQWRYLPSSYPPWGAIWQQWRRWVAAGVWEEAMRELSKQERRRSERQATPSMVMLDAQTVRGGRSGLTFHERGGRGGYTRGREAIDPRGLHRVPDRSARG
jgi:putative transposase